MNAFVLNHLRKKYAENKEQSSEEGVDEEVGSLIPNGNYKILKININKFEKPVGAVIMNGQSEEIVKIIDIKKA